VTKPSVEEKAQAYLVAGAVSILTTTERRVEARVQGSSPDPYTVEWNGLSWSCTCPAYVNRCAHVTAVRKVVSERHPVVRFETSPSEVDALFE
jgi:uncharacterized Zn finger protein